MIQKLTLKESKKMVPYQSSPLNLYTLPIVFAYNPAQKNFQGVQEFLKINVIFDILFCYQFEMDEEDGIFTSVIIIMLTWLAIVRP